MPAPVAPAASAAAREGLADAVAHPPETIEGWYALHQVLRVDRAALRALGADARARLAASAAATLEALAAPEEGGWTAAAQLAGSGADVLLVHLRPTLDGITEVRRQLAREPLFDYLSPAYTFLSVTEAGLYHITASLTRAARARGGKVGDAEYVAELERRVAAERDSDHLRRRLYPSLPPEMPYLCFYPMSKRREEGQNWYTLPVDERSRLMYEHGITGREFAGRVMQIVTGAIGLDAWEWGVTLFAGDPLDFKKLVTNMRFDEGSAKYASFGDFYVGRVAAPRAVVEAIVDVPAS